MALIDLTGTGAAFDGSGSTGTIECNLLGLEGQNAVVLQQNHSLTGRLIGNGQVLLLPLGHFVGIACFGQ